MLFISLPQYTSLNAMRLHVLLMKHVCGHLIWRWRLSRGGCDKRRWWAIWSADCARLDAGRASRTLHSISAVCSGLGVHQEHPVISTQKYYYSFIIYRTSGQQLFFWKFQIKHSWESLNEKKIELHCQGYI